MNNSPKRLYRSRTDKVIAGVCGGLGAFFNVDPVLFRILFVILAVAGGSGILIYLVMTLIIPKEGSGEGIDLSKEKVGEAFKESAENVKQEAEKFAHRMKRHETHPRTARKLFGLVVLAIGIVALLHQFFPFPWFVARLFGPLLIIFIGIVLLAKK